MILLKQWRTKDEDNVGQLGRHGPEISETHAADLLTLQKYSDCYQNRISNPNKKKQDKCLPGWLLPRTIHPWLFLHVAIFPCFYHKCILLHNLLQYLSTCEMSQSTNQSKADLSPGFWLVAAQIGDLPQGDNCSRCLTTSVKGKIILTWSYLLINHTTFTFITGEKISILHHQHYQNILQDPHQHLLLITSPSPPLLSPSLPCSMPCSSITCLARTPC